MQICSAVTLFMAITPSYANQAAKMERFSEAGCGAASRKEVNFMTTNKCEKEDRNGNVFYRKRLCSATKFTEKFYTDAACSTAFAPTANSPFSAADGTSIASSFDLELNVACTASDSRWYKITCNSGGVSFGSYQKWDNSGCTGTIVDSGDFTYGSCLLETSFENGNYTGNTASESTVIKANKLQNEKYSSSDCSGAPTQVNVYANMRPCSVDPGNSSLWVTVTAGGGSTGTASGAQSVRVQLVIFCIAICVVVSGIAEFVF